MFYHRISKQAFLPAIFCFLFLFTFSANLTLSNTSLAQGAKAPTVPIEAFAALANASSVKVSPTGKWLSMIREVNGVPNIYIQELTNSENSFLIPPTDKLEISWYEWVNEDWIIFSTKMDSYINNTPVLRTVLVSFDMTTKKAYSIIKPSKRGKIGSHLGKGNPPQIQDKVIDILKDEPYHIMVAVDGNRDGAYEIRHVDIRDGKYKYYFNDRRGIQNWEMDHLGNLRMGSGYDKYKMKHYYFTPGTKKLTPYEKFAAKGQGMMPAAYTDDLDVVIMRETFSERSSRFVHYNMKTDEITKILFDNEDYSPNGIMYAPTLGSSINGKPIGVSYTKDKVHRSIFDSEWAKLYRSVNKALPSTSNRIVSATEDKTILVILASSDQEPGAYYMWNRPKKEFFGLVLVNPKIYPEQMTPMKRINYAARDGLNIPAYLTTPLGVEAKNLPLVVMPHGGPAARDYMSYSFFTQFLANRGYAVLQPNYRGSTGYREDFQKAGLRQWGLAMQDDVTDGVKHLIKEGIADPNRVCIIGSSYGGYAALMGAVKTPDLYQCAASINGVTHLGDMIAHDKKFIGGRVWSKSIANDDTPSDQLDETSPAEQVDKIKAPILLIQYEDDRSVPKSQARTMRRALKNADKKFTYIEFEKGGHSMESRQSRIEVLTEIEKFLAKHLN